MKLSGTDAQIDQSKGNSPLTAAQIRANINALGGGATTSSVLAQGPQVLQPVLSTSVASDSAAVGDTARKVPSRGTLSLPDHKLFTDEDFDKVPSPVQPVIQVLPNSGYERLWEDFRHWIDSI